MPRQQRVRVEVPSGLYGIEHSNRTAEAHWGKNCFNSSFPAAVANYMLAHDIPAVYNHLAIVDGQLKVQASEIRIQEIFNCGELAPNELDFRFETRFEPYGQYSFDPVDGIDLVVKAIDGRFLSPLEVKLTVLPDNSTLRKAQDKWGCEIVVRAATTSYCALGMFDSVKENVALVRDIFEAACSNIGSWTNDYEMSHKTPALSLCLNAFERQYLDKQKPLVMQTIWKTQGQSPELADNAFDIIVWSDYAFSRLFIDAALTAEPTMSRPMRAAARLARCLWELSKSGKIRLNDIYRQMAFGKQTDKEFSVNGIKWRGYVSHPRLLNPILPKTVLSEIIQPGGIERLHPERRFDQTLYFTMRV